MRVRIGINAHLLSFTPTYRAAGVNRYIVNLLRGLADLDQENSYIIFANGPHLAQDLGSPPNFEIHSSSFPTEKPAWRVLFEQALLPSSVRRRRLDIFHAPVNVLPWRQACPGVVTIHDLSFLRYPENFVRAKRDYQRIFSAHSVHQARRIIAVSAATRDDLIRYFHVDPAKIAVGYNAVDPRFQPIQDPKRLELFRKEQGLPGRYILYMGTLEPRKNLETLVEAFGLLRRQYDLPHTLIIAGAKGWLYNRIFSRVQDLDLEKWVRFPGYIPNEAQPLWYSAADLFVYPSLYEGFGLPLVEAMACGTPVVTSNVSCLPEIGGDAVLTVDPYDAGELARSMYTVVKDTLFSARLRRQGLARAAHFSMRNMAAQVLRVYNDAAQAA